VSATATVPAGATSTNSLGIGGAHVHVLGVWSGPELASFEAVASAWEKASAAVVDWEGTDDMGRALADHRQAGDPPDIAILPNLALMDQLARDDALIPLNTVLDMTAIEKDYGPAWIELGSRDEQLYGIFYKVTDKAGVWYNPKAFAAAGYNVPTTWNEMTMLADTIVGDGHTPFSVVAARGPASGWALTDWISEIVLNTCGPDLYDEWIASGISWNDACIKRSFGMFTKLVSTKGYVLGGSQRIIATGDDAGADPLYTDPPSAYLCYLPSFAQAFIAASHPDLEPGTDYDVFRFPTIDPRYKGAVTIGADVPVMVSDTPAARAFMTYLASAPAQEAWIKLGGFTSVNRSVSMDSYQDPVARTVAEELSEAKVSRFSAGDMMPASLQRAWWGAMLDLVTDPTKVDSILDRMTAAAESAR
jgi:alpha-glucoside transport system substrate-binding protein